VSVSTLGTAFFSLRPRISREAMPRKSSPVATAKERFSEEDERGGGGEESLLSSLASSFSSMSVGGWLDMEAMGEKKMSTVRRGMRVLQRMKVLIGLSL